MSTLKFLDDLTFLPGSQLSLFAEPHDFDADESLIC